MNIAELRVPTEVYDFANGDRRALVKLLRGEEPITPSTRRALADQLEGKLQSRNNPGRPRKTFAEIMWDRIPVDYYKRLAKILKARRGSKFNRFELIDAVAKKFNMDFETLNNRINRSAKKTPIKSSIKYPYL